MFLIGLRKSFLLFALLAASFATGQPASAAAPDKLSIISLLQARDFSALDRLYDTANQGKGRRSGFQAFQHSDPTNEAHLSAWIDARPGSAIPLIARGSYYSHLGWLSRGGASRRDTHPAQFAAMHAYFAQAKTDFRAAIALSPEIDVTYGALMRLAMAQSDDTAFAELMRRGLEAAPLSPAIHGAVINNLLPQWGGSLEMLGLYVEQLKKRVGGNSDFAYLYGYLEEILAVQAYSAGDPESALEYLNAAIDQAATAHRLAARSEMTFKEDSEKAIADISRAIELDPENPHLYTTRADYLVRKNEFERARSDAETAIALDPFHSRFLVDSADVLFQVGKSALRDGNKEEYNALVAQGLDALDRAMVYGKASVRINKKAGDAISSNIFKYDIAANFYERAAELSPDDPEPWEIFTRSLAISRNCTLLPKIEKTKATYEDVCTAAKCKPARDLDHLLLHLQRTCDPGSVSEDPRIKRQKTLVRRMGRCRPYFETKDWGEAFAACLGMAESGDPSAQIDLSIAYMNNIGTALNRAAGAYWAEQAAEQGDPDGMGLFGQILLAGVGGREKDDARAVALLEQSAAGGSAWGLTGLAHAYHEGIGLPKDHEKAYGYLEEAEKLGSQHAEEMRQQWQRRGG